MKKVVFAALAAAVLSLVASGTYAAAGYEADAFHGRPE